MTEKGSGTGQRGGSRLLGNSQAWLLAAPAVLLLHFEGGSVVKHILRISFHPKLGQRDCLHVEGGRPFLQTDLCLHGIPQC